MRKINFNRLAVTLGVGISVGQTVHLALIFFYGYFNNYRTVCVSNLYGEAHIEAIIIPAMVILCVYALVQIMKKY